MSKISTKKRNPVSEPRSALAPGTEAPDFTLHSTPDQKVSLSEFRGQPVILAFYPADRAREYAPPQIASRC